MPETYGVPLSVAEAAVASVQMEATTVTPGAFWLDAMLRATTQWPVNVVLLGKGNTANPDALW